MLLQALDASRRSQADRELHYYRHLVDRKASLPGHAKSSNSTVGRPPLHRSPVRRIAIVLAIALLAVVASLEVFGGILIASHAQTPANASIMLRGD